jgi:putative transposase
MAHKYRLQPSDMQLPVLGMHCAHARAVWNVALEQANLYRKHWGPTPNAAVRQRQLAEARKDSWLSEGSSSVQQQALRDFDQALKNWWAGTHGRPTWRSKERNNSFRVRDVNVRKINRRWAELSVPKLGMVRFRLSRPLPAEYGMATISMPTLLTSGEAQRKVRLQRHLARQRKGSNRRARTKHAIARLSAREADRRNNWIEQTTTDLVRRFDRISIEDLQVKNMVRSASGTIEEPGTNVAQKRGLNRSIHRQAWAKWRTRLEQKAAAATEQCQVIAVNPCRTSQRCARCGHTEPNNRESQAVFVCRACGHRAHADVNASENINAAGHAVAGRGGRHGSPVEASTTRAA